MNDPIHHSETNISPPFNNNNESWERQTLRDVLFAAYKEQRRARIWKTIRRCLYLLIFIGIITSLISTGDGNNTQNTAAAKKDHTAVIDLTGVIGGDDNDQAKILRDGMQAAYKNPRAKAIIIHANSPGGSPVVSNIAFEEVRRLKALHNTIPVYVVASDLCASGCYYIAAAADKIYADPSSLVGSIGVVGSGFDVTGLMEKIGIKYRQRTAGSNKGMGSPFAPETPEQLAIWQKMLEQIHGEFIQAVKTGRGTRLQEKNHPDLFSGRVYTGIEAKQVGLIDDFGNIYSVARDIVKAPELVNYTPQDTDLSHILSRNFRAQMKSQIQTWLNQIW